MSLGPAEILVVLVVALLVLGPDKLPQAARQMGKFYREIREFSSTVRTQVEDALEMDDKPSTAKKEAIADNPPIPDTTGFKLVDDEPLHARPAPDDPVIDPDAPNLRPQD